MAVEVGDYVLAVPKFRAVKLTAENRADVAAWCGLPQPPGRSLMFEAPAEPGDFVVRPAEWGDERPGGFTYTAEEMVRQFDRWVP